MLVNACLFALSNAYFEAQQKLNMATSQTFRRLFSASFTAFRRLLLRGSARRRLIALSICCHAAFISTFTLGSAHQLCTPHGRLECAASSSAVESMTSDTSVVVPLTQLPSGIGGSAALIAFGTSRQRLGSVINRWRSPVLKVSLKLSLLLRFDADLREMQTFA